jgi:predicted ArsR family transcriptional regulator
MAPDQEPRDTVEPDAGDTGRRDALDSVTALGDPTRRRLYEHVCAQPALVGRDEVANAVGIGRTLAAYHLDRLADAGLLEVAYRRRSGRDGPGAGRPAKLYGRAQGDVSVSLPPRDYGIAARLLADAAAADPTGETRRALRDAALRLGRELAAEAADDELEHCLAARGYEPCRDADGTVRLRNCPFHSVAQRHPEVVCDMNLSLLRGLAGEARDVALEPRPGRCCVAIR